MTEAATRLTATLESPSSVLLNVPERLDTAALEALIRSLVDLRVTMQPAVSRADPAVSSVLLHPLWRIRLDRQGGSWLLSVRHPGVGWLHFEFSPPDMEEFRKAAESLMGTMDSDQGPYTGPDRRRAH